MIRIKLSNIEIFGYHGAYNEEKQVGQKFLICIEYELISNPSSDHIKNTINYVDIMDYLFDQFNIKRYELLESLVEKLSLSIKKQFNMKYIKISIKKFPSVLRYKKPYKLKDIKVEIEQKD